MFHNNKSYKNGKNSICATCVKSNLKKHKIPRLSEPNRSKSNIGFIKILTVKKLTTTKG